MAFSSGRRGPSFRAHLSFAFAICLFACGTGPAALAADINVFLDEAKLVKMPEKIATIVIGNPAIADATIQAGGMMVLTGKGYGMTNVIALDRSGSVLMDRSVQVQGPRGDVVVVFRGLERESYSCTPQCERRVTLGDGQPYFDLSSTQATIRNGLAQGAVAPK